MTTPRQIPPVRTRRVMVSQPLPYEAALGVRSQEGEFVFMGPQAAANEARLKREFVGDGDSRLNVPMLIVVAALLLAISGGAALLVTWLAPHLLLAYNVAQSEPFAVGVALGCSLAMILTFSMVLRATGARS